MPDFLLNAWTDSNEILRVYTVHSPRSLEICIEFRFHVPLRNIFLIEHIWRFWETRHFRFRVGIGSRKWPHAVERDKLYIPSKFHSNLPCSFGGEEGSTLKKRDLSAKKVNVGSPYLRGNFDPPQFQFEINDHVTKIHFWSAFKLIENLILIQFELMKVDQN